MYYKQLYPNDTLPFKLNNLTFKLIVTRLNLGCEIILSLKKDAIANIDSIVKQVDEFITVFNEKSMKKDREEGVIHHAKYTIDDENCIVCDIDLGSVGYSFFKKLLKQLSKINLFTKVEIL